VVGVWGVLLSSVGGRALAVGTLLLSLYWTTQVRSGQDKVCFLSWEDELILSFSFIIGRQRRGI
jgi:hypothetical protein